MAWYGGAYKNEYMVLQLHLKKKKGNKKKDLQKKIELQSKRGDTTVVVSRSKLARKFH